MNTFRYRIAIDMGGTFTDLVLDDGTGHRRAVKASTTPQNPIQGILSALMKAAQMERVDLAELLGRTDQLIHGTTRALNAITTGDTARTAFVTTKGHPDILLYAEGGRTDLFNFTVPARKPYIPRSLTVEVNERIGAGGRVITALTEPEIERVVERVKGLDVEAAAVCLLWSPANPDHENRLGQALSTHLPDISVTLSHQLNPTLREYRRASSAAIDASLKPLMGQYLSELEQNLRSAGFDGRLLVVTSSGGFQDASSVAGRPILSVRSGPAMAPVAGRRYANSLTPETPTAIIADTGGTTYDVSLVRDGRIPTTRETWVGPQYLGDMTGFSSIDIRSIGAGGGSIAWMDRGGVLHVGPQSAGSVPGPACYGLGGTAPTLTDACVVLGYIDPDYFLGGTMRIDRDLACDAVQVLANQLGIGLFAAAEAIHRLATERMVSGIEQIALSQGDDPSKATLVAGGGAGGLNADSIGRRLGCATVIVPQAAPVMSAYGALASDLTDEYELPLPSSSVRHNPELRSVLDRLRASAMDFVHGPGQDCVSWDFEYSVEARYAQQVWELSVPFTQADVDSGDLESKLSDAFHRLHQQTFAVCDTECPVEFISWHGHISCHLTNSTGSVLDLPSGTRPQHLRQVYFRERGYSLVPVLRGNGFTPGSSMRGPAIIETPMTTIVVDPESTVARTPEGDFVLSLTTQPMETPASSHELENVR